jgi:hypothetical protein
MRPEIVLVQSRAHFSADDAEVAVLLLHFRQSGVKVFEVATEQELTAAKGWLDTILRNTPGRLLAACQQRMTALKSRATKRRNRKQSGRRPYGSSPDERKVLKRIWRLRRRRRNDRPTSYPEIARMLNRDRLLSRSGRPWQPRTIQAIIRRTRPELD